jgi:hypothetical protein
VPGVRDVVRSCLDRQTMLARGIAVVGPTIEVELDIQVVPKS